MSPIARHQCEQTEYNYVAEAFNWEQRVKGENDAARAWTTNWGLLFSNQPTSYKYRIEELKRKMTMEKLPVQTNYQMSYTKVNPYREIGNKDHRRKTYRDDDDIELSLHGKSSNSLRH